MTSRTIGRVAAAGVVTTVLACAGAGPAAADGGPVQTTSGAAFAFLWTGDDAGPAVFFDLFAPPGQDPFANLEVFSGGYACLTGDRLPAQFDPVAGTAQAAGTLALLCEGPDLPAVTGRAVVELAFTAGTTQDRVVLRDGRCVVHRWVREADVTGTVTVDVPAFGAPIETVAREGDLTVDERRCTPWRRR